jgi:hypothetical protein
MAFDPEFRLKGPSPTYPLTDDSIHRRDYQCPITKKVDRLRPNQSRAEYITLESAYILPFSLNKFDEADE